MNNKLKILIAATLLGVMIVATSCKSSENCPAYSNVKVEKTHHRV